MDFGGIGGAIGKGLLELVLPGLATVIAGQVVALLRRLATKQGIAITAAQEERLRKVVADVIRRVEEAARRQHMTPDQKRTAATDGILRELAGVMPQGSEAPTRETVGKMIDSVLPTVRAELEPRPIVVVPPAGSE
jgi:hypothetical protein